MIRLDQEQRCFITKRSAPQTYWERRSLDMPGSFQSETLHCLYLMLSVCIYVYIWAVGPCLCTDELLWFLSRSLDS